jgi:uridine phosphorylase
MALERLIAFGAKRFWILGWCGSIQPDLKVGDWVVPVSAFSEEGTSPHYPIGKEGPHWDAQLGRKMTQALEERGIPFEAGPVWSTDAPFRETPSKVKAYQSEGVLAVEMEMSALMTVGIYRAVSVVGLLVVSDELSELTWRPGFSNPRLKEHSRLAAEMLWALATASTPKEGSGEKGGPSE